jgi:hypothetical protein
MEQPGKHLIHIQGMNFKGAQQFLLKKGHFLRKMQKGHFLIENTERRFAFEQKETGRAPRQLRWAPRQMPWMLS